jgi:hypothetical protein
VSQGTPPGDRPRAKADLKQKTPPVVAGQGMLGRFLAFELSAAPPARHATVMVMAVMPV